MRSSNKSRSRNKNNNRNRNVGNIVNRVFDSAGPDGKVRGTPQQVIEKYQTLARDAQLAGDRVAAENFQQHAEHYARMLGEAQREQAERQAEQQQRQQDQQAQNAPQPAQDRSDPADAPQPDVDIAAQPVGQDGPGLVDTPENRSDGDANGKPRKPRNRKPKAEVIAETSEPAAEPVQVAPTQPGAAAE